MYDAQLQGVPVKDVQYDRTLVRPSPPLPPIYLLPADYEFRLKMSDSSQLPRNQRFNVNVFSGRGLRRRERRRDNEGEATRGT